MQPFPAGNWSAARRPEEPARPQASARQRRPRSDPASPMRRTIPN